MINTNNLRQVALWVLLVAVSWEAYARDGATKDPTLPPEAWLSAKERATVAAPGKKGDSDAGKVSRVGVIVVGKARRFALVDGKVIREGDVLNETKVVAIRPDRVATADGTKSLGMTPNVEKRAPNLKPVRRKVVVVPERAAADMASGK